MSNTPKLNTGEESTLYMGENTFRSHKEVKAIPLDRESYCEYRGWDVPENENGTDPGYLVEYLDGGEANDSRHEGYISWSPKAQFDAGYTVSVPSEAAVKTLHNSNVSGAKVNVADLVVFGNGDMFQLISKASSKNEDWMKSTKAMEIPAVGCVIQVTTQQGWNVAEALTFVPGVTIVIGADGVKRILQIEACAKSA